MNQVRLHIADSKFVMRTGLSALFESTVGVELVAVTADSESLKTDLMDASPEVLLINYQSEGFHASDVMQSLRLLPGLKVIGITPTCDVETIQQLLESGLNGHLLCDCDQDEITDSVTCSARGEKFFCGKVLERLNQDKDSDKHYSCEPVTISERELEILQLIAQGLTNKQIAEKIHLSFHTVMTHRKNMMNKLGINNTAGLIIYAVRENLISPNRFLFSQTDREATS
ncbi:MAG: response regulator transcription factor [Salibacteraceae bacterium]